MAKEFWGAFAQEDGKSGRVVKFLRFWDGSTMTAERCYRLNAVRLLRREVLRKQAAKSVK